MNFSKSHWLELLGKIIIHNQAYTLGDFYSRLIRPNQNSRLNKGHHL